jgi:hypothetical protein
LLNIQRIARQLTSTDGAEIAEAAMVLPLVFMLLLGTVWFGRAFNIYSTIQQAAQQGAITAARASCASCGDAAASNTTVYNTIEAVMQASNLDPTKIQSSASPVLNECPSPPGYAWPRGAGCRQHRKIWICRDMQLNPPPGGPQPPQCGSVVSFQYPFQSSLPFTSLNMSQIILSAQAQSRMEN